MWIDLPKSKHTVIQWRKLTEEIRLYLKTEMMSTDALDRLIRNMGVSLEEP